MQSKQNKVSQARTAILRDAINQRQTLIFVSGTEQQHVRKVIKIPNIWLAETILYGKPAISHSVIMVRPSSYAAA
jgi:uncharacterized protein (UPF0218 family)